MSELVHVKGFAELDKLLETLPMKLQKNVMRGALRAGINVLKSGAKTNINNISGELANSLYVRTKVEGQKVIASVIAGRGFGKKGTPPKNLPLWVEYGTAAHWIKVAMGEGPVRYKRARGGSKFGEWKTVSIRTMNKMAARGSLKIGSSFIGSSVVHPGATPHPFMRTAFDTGAGDAVVAAGEYIKNRLATKEGLDTAGIEIGISE